MPQLIDQPEPLTGKPPISEKKLAANRANAQKSTGPRTDAGKAVSRRNAAKHFMTGDGIVLPAEMDDQIEREIAAVAARLAPVDDYDWRLVREAAVAGVRFDRVAQIQEANLVLQGRACIWILAFHEAVRPADTRRSLRSMREGSCR